MRSCVLQLKKYVRGFYHLNNTLMFSLMSYCIAGIHAIITAVFLYFDILPLYTYNIIITLWYIFMGHVLVPRNHYVFTYLCSLAEILFHSIFVSILVGWDWGFMIYTIALVPVGYYMSLTIPKMRQELAIPICSTLLIFLCFVVTKTICGYITPIHSDLASTAFVNFYYCFNTAITFFMLLFFSILFSVELKQMQNQLIKEKENLNIIASHDPLTQLLNRRSMEAHLSNVFDIAQKTGVPFSLIIGDIDDFKKVNDTYGHSAGDQVLIEVSKIIRSQLRSEDFACRWGGEEILLLIHSDEEVGVYIAERIRQVIQKTPIIADENAIYITMTFGVSSYNSGCNVEKIIHLADQKLYDGKKHGKNQVVY